MIQLQQVSKINQAPVLLDGFHHVNCLSWFPSNVQVIDGVTIPTFQVSPYHLKQDGCIFENIWQGSKIYPIVAAQHQISGNKVIWDYPMEIHINEQNEVTPAYWQWREKLMRHDQPVRYPNGYTGRHNCRCAVVVENGAIRCLDYLSARREIYVRRYSALVRQTEAFQALQQLLATGHNLTFTDIDCPADIMVDQDSYDQYLNNDQKPFGHTWVLAATLLALKLE